MSLFEENFKKLEELVGEDLVTWSSRAGRVIKRNSTGFMELVIESLGYNHISMTHYFKQNGDLVCDPDMELQVHPNTKMLTAIHLQDTLGYWVVYPEPGKVDARQLKAQNAFLADWLKNLRDQGFYPSKGGD